MRILIQKYGLLIFLLIVTVVLRLHEFSSPIADWHSWRQADTSAVTRNFYKIGFDMLHPRFDDLSNVPSGFDNPKGYRFVEFPIYNILQASMFSLAGGLLTIEQAGRLVSIFSSVSIVLLLYLLVCKYLHETAGFLAAAFYAFSPFTIFYGRTILPDTTMAASILAAIFFFSQWADNSTLKNAPKRNLWGYYLLALFFTSIAFLLKPYALFFVFPMLVIVWYTWGMRALLIWQLWVFGMVSLIPLIGWRMWMMQYPEGIPVNQWLLNGNGIRFRPAFFRWIGYERLLRLISGYTGVVFLVLGLLQLRRLKNWLFFLSFIVSSILYVVIFATGNVQHDYYQILIMPTVAIIMGIGGYVILKLFSPKRKNLGYLLISLFAVSSFYFSWMQIKDYFNINNRKMVEVGRLVDKTVPPDSKVIALYFGDTTFLYHTNRQGWASFQNPLPEMIQKGADYLVQLEPTSEDIKTYESLYDITASSSGYVIVKLH